MSEDKLSRLRGILANYCAASVDGWVKVPSAYPQARLRCASAMSNPEIELINFLSDTAPSEAEPPTSLESSPDERRGAVRKEPHQFKSELRLAVAGFPMRLVNLSSTGLLAETNQRLCPGRTVDVFLRYAGIRRVLRATVIRSTMHAVAPNPVFRAALQFEDVLTLQDAEL